MNQAIKEAVIDVLHAATEQSKKEAEDNLLVVYFNEMIDAYRDEPIPLIDRISINGKPYEVNVKNGRAKVIAI